MLRAIFTVSAFILAAAPAAASTYSASLSGPAGGRIVGHDIVWSCGSGTCQGTTDESRPPVICQSLARQAGKVNAFLADGRAFTPTELEKCNASARVDSGKALGTQ